MAELRVSQDPAYFRRQGVLARFRLTPWRFKWFMALYPPLLVNGVRAVRVAPTYQHVRVKLAKTWLNTNFNGSIFGGTLAAAFDPWLGVMYWQILTHRGVHALVVNLSLKVEFKRPAVSRVWMDFTVTDAEVEAALASLAERGKHVVPYTVQALDRQGTCIAQAEVVLHIRTRQATQPTAGISF